MDPRQIIRTDIAASAMAHLSVLLVVIFFAEVHPFGSTTAETVAVDIVTPQEVAEIKPEPLPEPKAQPSDALDPSSGSAAPSAPAAQAAATPQNPAVVSTPRADPQPSAQQAPPAPSPPVYASPQPDLSVKYHVMLGLPPDMPPSLPQARSGDAFDSEASKAADIASSLVTEFRRHLRTCAKLPGSIALSDKIKIKLRAFLTPEGRLAAEPILIEASASMKGPMLMQSAIEALKACQPYAMLPVDRYGEWKVLDLNFTPEDFSG